MNAPVVALVGNPNCGKTTLFNALTGSRQQVGNWPGVTVEKKSGHYVHAGTRFELVDLPGVYALGASARGSEDECVARDYVLGAGATLYVNIVDAASLERNLYLSTQLLDLGVPMVLALNMIDVAREQGLAIDTAALAAALGCPVVAISAARGEGLDSLRGALAALARAPQPPHARVDWPPAIANAIEQLAPLVAPVACAASVAPGWLALKLLEGEGRSEALLDAGAHAQLDAVRAAAAAAGGEDADILIADARYRTAGALVQRATRHTHRLSRTATDRIDAVVLHRVLGLPIFLAVMYLMFLVTVDFGSAFIDFFDQAAGAIFVDQAGAGLAVLGAPEWLRVVLADGVGSGVQTVATFVPIIGCLFLCLSALEDSGYMARAAFVMDRLMRGLGLPGKAFVPLLVGFGCNVPAVMATRTLERRGDRILTAMMTPFMSCGARLPVYALFAVAFFPGGGQNVVFLLYLTGIACAVLTAVLLKRTLGQTGDAHFVMELPLYHLPTAANVLRRTWERLREFVLRAGALIVPMVLVLNLLNTLGSDGSFGNENTERSLLTRTGQTIVPLFEPMGIRPENWQAAVGLFTGVLAKEAVIGTLNALYAEAGADGATPAEEQDFPLAERLVAALATIPENLAGLAARLGDPLGLDVGYADDPDAAATALEADRSVFGAMAVRFDGATGAFAYLLMILLYIPCVATNGAIRHELGAGWMAFAMLWTTTLAYSVATIFYQAAHYARDPAGASLWITGCLFACGVPFALVRLALRRSSAAGARALPAGRAP